MTGEGKIVQAAKSLTQRYEAREFLDIMLQDVAPTTIEDAYLVQEPSWAYLGRARDR